ncbi:MAG TPA: DUF2851 family protein [Candidatus Avirikenella pullistercoris]|nr:DUF2851 family protein [Candidatus Avirikenella pullistercoris]
MESILKLLRFIWGRMASEHPSLHTVSGESLTVIHPGIPAEEDNGADFLNATLLVENTRIKGNIKILKCSSDWYKWNDNTAKNGIVLVLTFQPDIPRLTSPTGTPIPIFRPAVGKELADRHNRLTQERQHLCCRLLGNYDNLKQYHLFSRLVVERIENKCLRIENIYKKRNSWNDTALFCLFDTINIGNTRNRKRFNHLLETIGFNDIIKNLVPTGSTPEDIETSKQKIEALLLGTAGFLDLKPKPGDNFPFILDSYVYQMRETFHNLRHIFQITPMRLTEWDHSCFNKNLTLSILLAQLAAILAEHPNLYHEILEADDIFSIKKLLRADTSVYWHTHNAPNTETPFTETHRQLSEGKINIFIINFIIPFLFLHHQLNGQNDENNDYEIAEKLIGLLENTPGESNYITNKWNTHIPIDNAFYSQAIIELQKKYCALDNCFDCPIGIDYLKGNAVPGNK